MTEPIKPEVKEEKSQAQLDYEAGQEFLKNLEPAQAANAFHNALIAFELEGDDNGIANAADKLGDICAKRGDVEKAMSHYDRAYAICQKHTDRFSLFSIEKKKAKLMYDAKNYEQAVALYLDVLDEYSALRNPQGSVDTLEILAEIYLAQGEKNKAADAYRTAASIHQNFKHSRHAEQFRQKAAEIEKE
ncbi:tetratricopeptide repeat protein [Thiovibrio frasassiensis]|uniref:Tetratricopeptide repeat protein n=1 Tax=Thiovibrio frasassiensis TaxID=2984131 RepID=A0A9X4MEE7_9BACT|nr:tetratricopeptide repeat protein [Thiovibrio frasassiensis]MDG4474768.1 tetratricopeptide repeat protein [Thiovibrio frasassiensis]